MSDENSAVEFLTRELSLAFTLLDCARISGIKENIVRYHQSAQTAYETVSRLLETAKLDRWERERIAAQLNTLKLRLKALDTPSAPDSD